MTINNNQPASKFAVGATYLTDGFVNLEVLCVERKRVNATFQYRSGEKIPAKIFDTDNGEAAQFGGVRGTGMNTIRAVTLVANPTPASN